MFQRYWAGACLTAACVGTLLMCASPAIAAHVEPTAEPLWNAFPLYPPGKRFVETGEHRFVPPTTDALEAFVPASDGDRRLIVSPATLLVLSCAALIAPIVLLRLFEFLRLFLLFRLFRLFSHPPSSPKANQDGSGGRLFALSVIGGLVGAEVLYGYAIYTVVVLLL
jgi:hypothetical protein